MKEEHAPGERKIFGDKERVLDHTTDGLRWKATGNDNASGGGAQGPNGGAGAPIILSDYEPPKFINREEWLPYNQYLNLENPFIDINTYEEGLNIWHQRLLNLKNKQEIKRYYEKLNEANGYPVNPANTELQSIEDEYKLLNNNFYAMLMYKTCVLISRIEYLDSSFDYDQFIQDHSWKELMEYLNELENGQ